PGARRPRRAPLPPPPRAAAYARRGRLAEHGRASARRRARRACSRACSPVRTRFGLTVLVAGVDVGNSTTEIAVARVEPGGEPEWLFVARRATTGTKGSAACAAGVADLLARADRRLGERPHITLLAELHPVETGLLELGLIEELALERTAIARPASETPSGSGVGAGRLVRLQDLLEPAEPETVIPIVEDTDFEAAGAALRDARSRGWTIAGAIVQKDDSVLVGN